MLWQHGRAFRRFRGVWEGRTCCLGIPRKAAVLVHAQLGATRDLCRYFVSGRRLELPVVRLVVLGHDFRPSQVPVLVLGVVHCLWIANLARRVPMRGRSRVFVLWCHAPLLRVCHRRHIFRVRSGARVVVDKSLRVVDVLHGRAFSRTSERGL